MANWVICDLAADPAVVFVAPVAGHMVAPTDLVDRGFAIGTFRYSRVDVVHEKSCLSRDLAGCLMHRVTALEARLKATYANGSSIAAAARASDGVFAAGSCAPLQFV